MWHIAGMLAIFAFIGCRPRLHFRIIDCNGIDILSQDYIESSSKCQTIRVIPLQTVLVQRNIRSSAYTKKHRPLPS